LKAGVNIEDSEEGINSELETEKYRATDSSGFVFHDQPQVTKM